MAEKQNEAQKQQSKADEIRIGVYVCHCGKNIAGSVDCEEVAKYASTLPHVVLSKHNLYTCSDPGQETIKKDIKEHKEYKKNRKPESKTLVELVHSIISLQECGTITCRAPKAFFGAFAMVLISSSKGTVTRSAHQATTR